MNEWKISSLELKSIKIDLAENWLLQHGIKTVRFDIKILDLKKKFTD